MKEIEWAAPAVHPVLGQIMLIVTISRADW
jgi:hypothetical protein